MSKRRKHPLGAGKGRHGSEVQPAAKRPPGEIKPIISKSKHGKMIHQFHDTDQRPITDGCAGILAAIVALILMFPRCGNSQNIFQFEAKSTFLIVDKNPPVAFGKLPVSAWADTLLIGPAALPLIRLYNVNWTRTDSGNLYHMAPGVQIRYDVGPGGRSVYIRAGQAVVEAYELITDKM